MPRKPQGPWFRSFTGWWVVQIRGEQVKLARGRENEAAAIQRFHEIMASLPQSPDSPTVDVESLFEAFLQWTAENQSSETLRGYRFYLQCFADEFGRRQVRSLRVSDAERWLKKKSGTWNSSTRRNAVRNVKAALNWAVRQEYISVNPLANLKAPTPAKRVRCVTDAEYESLIGIAPAKFRDYLVALRFTGTRPSELRNLRWEERDGSRFIVHNHKTVKKTKKPRVIYLSDELAERINWLHTEANSEFVFTNTRGKMWTYNATRLQFDRLKKRLGFVDGLSMYCFRHRFITDALANDVPLAKICELVGHTSPQMIMQVYGHLIDKPEEMRDSINAATRSLNGSLSGLRPQEPVCLNQE